MTRLYFLFCLCLIPFASGAPKDSDAQATAQVFYDGYMKALANDGDAAGYVMKSERVTSGFKKVYKAFMKEPDADPVICAQDYPDAGFKAGKPSVDGKEATVKMSSRDSTFEHSFEVFLKNGENGWQINGTTDLKAKP